MSYWIGRCMQGLFVAGGVAAMVWMVISAGWLATLTFFVLMSVLGLWLMLATWLTMGRNISPLGTVTKQKRGYTSYDYTAENVTPTQSNMSYRLKKKE